MNTSGMNTSEKTRILIKTPVSSGPERAFEYFSRELEKDPLHTYLILPSKRLAGSLGEKLTAAGRGYPKRALSTLKGLAEEIVSSNPSYTLITDHQAKIILIGIIRKDPVLFKALSPSSDFSYRQLTDLYTFLYTLAMQDAEPVQLSTVSDLSEYEKAVTSALTAAAGKYLALIHERRLVPPELVYKTASEIISEKSEKCGYGCGNECRNECRNECGFKCIVFFGLEGLEPAKKKFIRALSDAAEKSVYFKTYSSSGKVCTADYDWYSPSEVISESAIGGDDAENLSCIFEDSESGEAETAVRIKIGKYANLKSELGAVLEKISLLAEAGTPYDKIAVSIPNLQKELFLVEECFRDFNIPASPAAICAMSKLPPVLAYMSLVKAVSSDFQPKYVQELYESPYFIYGTEVKSGIIDDTAAKAYIESGTAEWKLKLEKYIAASKESLSSPESKRSTATEADVEKAETLLNSVCPRLEELEKLKEKKSFCGHIKCIESFIRDKGIIRIDSACGKAVQEREKAEIYEFFRYLESLASSSEKYWSEKISFANFASGLISFVNQRKIPAAREKSGISIVSPDALYGMRYDYVFIIGLEDSAIPKVLPPLPYLTESQEKLIAPDRRRVNLMKERFRFVSAMYSAQKELWLSWHEDENERAAIASPFFNAAEKHLRHEPADDIIPVHSAVYAAETSGKKAASCAGTNDSSDIPSEIRRRIQIEEVCRRGEYDSVYDGVMESDAEIQEILRKKYHEKYAFSPTALETYQKCPFEYYMEKLLGLKELEESGREISTDKKGTLVHDLLCRFYTEQISNGKAGVTQENRAEAEKDLLRIAKEELSKYQMKGVVWHAFVSQLVEGGGYKPSILRRFLDEEIKMQKDGLIPAHFETSFGNGDKNSLSAYPAVLRAGEESCMPGAEIRIHGYIDRVDMTAPDPDGIRKFTITDYKTGSHSSQKDIHEGRSLQLPLYLRAFETLTENTQGIGGFYYNLKHGDVSYECMFSSPSEFAIPEEHRKKRGYDKQPPVEEITDISICAACAYADRIRSGIFSPADVSGSCPDWCRFKYICRFSELRLLEQVKKEESEDQGAE